MSMLPWDDATCNDCGGTFQRLPTQAKRLTLCPACRPPRPKVRVPGRRVKGGRG